MHLSNGKNAIGDRRFKAAASEMFERHCDEYEVVHNGCGRSEELPTELSARHRAEYRTLEDHRQRMSVMQWLRYFPDAKP